MIVTVVTVITEIFTILGTDLSTLPRRSKRGGEGSGDHKVDKRAGSRASCASGFRAQVCHPTLRRRYSKSKQA